MATAESQLCGTKPVWNLPSSAAAILLQEFFNEKVGQVEAHGAFDKTYLSDGLEHFDAQPRQGGELGCRPQRLTVRREPGTRRVVSAMLHTQMPNRLLRGQTQEGVPRADQWYGHVDFRSWTTHRQLAVVTTWQRPDTKLTPDGIEAYDEAYGDLFDHTGPISIPSGVENPLVTVYGRSDDVLSPDERGRLYYLTARVGEAVCSQLERAQTELQAPLQRPELVGAAV